MERRAWQGFGDWHYPGRAMDGMDGRERGERRERGRRRQTLGSNTDGCPRVTQQTETGAGQPDGHTAGLLGGQEHGAREVPAAAHGAQPLAGSKGIHPGPLSAPPCPEQLGRAKGGGGSAFPRERGEQHPCGIRGTSIPVG